MTKHPNVLLVLADHHNAGLLGGAGRCDYPLAGDGTAPNSIQPRFAEDSRNSNYI